jgi:hypothetical protein
VLVIEPGLDYLIEHGGGLFLERAVDLDFLLLNLQGRMARDRSSDRIEEMNRIRHSRLLGGNLPVADEQDQPAPYKRFHWNVSSAAGERPRIESTKQWLARARPCFGGASLHTNRCPAVPIH